MKRKEWITSRDDRVRDEHMEMEGETVGLEERYSNGDDFVGESSINCRCSELHRR